MKLFNDLKTVIATDVKEEEKGLIVKITSFFKSLNQKLVAFLVKIVEKL